MYGIIYKITNSINGKIYIGQTKNGLENRWHQHIYDASHNRTNMPIHFAMMKYGIENFTIECIDTAETKEELNQKEISYIKKYHS